MKIQFSYFEDEEEVPTPDTLMMYFHDVNVVSTVKLWTQKESELNFL